MGMNAADLATTLKPELIRGVDFCPLLFILAKHGAGGVVRNTDRTINALTQSMNRFKRR
jgi:hypothetical protein